MINFSNNIVAVGRCTEESSGVMYDSRCLIDISLLKRIFPEKSCIKITGCGEGLRTKLQRLQFGEERVPYPSPVYFDLQGNLLESGKGYPVKAEIASFENRKGRFITTCSVNVSFRIKQEREIPFLHTLSISYEKGTRLVGPFLYLTSYYSYGSSNIRSWSIKLSPNDNLDRFNYLTGKDPHLFIRKNVDDEDFFSVAEPLFGVSSWRQFFNYINRSW